ncbi:hypothetical protein PV327_010112 [Microctonus hyperodae]|uniref:Uncharacterized protein n=1 Tax=Microctonus hyperodae TaxID=165561 RepID=A0AA39FRI9_MICHY|nr:hypothetical protein PV327_010112 [Microctonus hyperodae]
MPYGQPKIVEINYSAACNWRSQDGWSLARFVHALNHTAASNEYLENNQNVSSKCKNVSSSDIEHTAIDGQDSYMGVDSRLLLDRKVLRSDQIIRPFSTAGRGMNHTRSPHFLTCVRNARFYYSSRLSITRSKFALLCRNGTDHALEEAIKKLKLDELPNIFDFKDTQVFHELVDYRPLGNEDSIEIKNSVGTDMEANTEQYITYENQVEICSGKKAYVGVPTAVFEKNEEKYAVKSFDDIDTHSDYDHIITKVDSAKDSIPKKMKKMTSESL